MTETILDQRDQIETGILLALHSRGETTRLGGMENSGNGWSREFKDLGSFCPKGAAHPKHCYTFDASDENSRIYGSDFSSIVVDPVLAIGASLETMMLCDDGTLKWSCAKPMPKPKGIVAITNMPPSWFCFYYKEIAADGTQTVSVKRPFAIAGGKPAMLKPLGQWRGFNPRQDIEEITTQVSLILSVFEDAHRNGVYIATVEERVKLSFPVGADAYKDFFKLRDGPNLTPTKRKNPILHWCSKHIRRRAVQAGCSEVSAHLRGTETIDVGPMSLRLSRSDGYGQFMKGSDA